MNALAVFIGRGEARAAQWAAGEVELRDAADECQGVAEAYGLVLGLGQDAVQWLMADAFRGVRAAYRQAGKRWRQWPGTIRAGKRRRSNIMTTLTKGWRHELNRGGF